MQYRRVLIMWYGFTWNVSLSMLGLVIYMINDSDKSQQAVNVFFFPLSCPALGRYVVLELWGSNSTCVVVMSHVISVFVLHEAWMACLDRGLYITAWPKNNVVIFLGFIKTHNISIFWNVFNSTSYASTANQIPRY